MLRCELARKNMYLHDDTNNPAKRTRYQGASAPGAYPGAPPAGYAAPGAYAAPYGGAPPAVAPAQPAGYAPVQVGQFGWQRLTT